MVPLAIGQKDGGYKGKNADKIAPSLPEKAFAEAKKKRKLLAAVSSLRNIGSRKAFNAWFETASEAGEQKRKLLAVIPPMAREVMMSS